MLVAQSISSRRARMRIRGPASGRYAGAGLRPHRRDRSGNRADRTSSYDSWRGPYNATAAKSYGITLMDLRLRWEWDPLRKDPRFQKIIAGPEPKTIY